MKILLVPLLLLSAAIGGSPGIAGDRTIIVAAQQPSIAEWSGRVTRRLDATLRYPDAGFGGDRSGLVSVAFTCSENGQPAAVALMRDSHNPVLNRAALSAIRQLGSLHPLPRQFGPEQRFRADIFFATSQSDLDQQIKAYRYEQRQMAQSHRAAEPVFALAIGAHPAG